MSILMCVKDDLPCLIDTADLPSSDGNPCFERLIEIAATLEQKGYEGIHVQCAPVDGGRFVISLNLLQGSLGEYVMQFFADYALTQKKIFSVDAALVIAAEFRKQESESSHE
jgi:hypothetical protein